MSGASELQARVSAGRHSITRKIPFRGGGVGLAQTLALGSLLCLPGATATDFGAAPHSIPNRTVPAVASPAKGL